MRGKDFVSNSSVMMVPAPARDHHMADRQRRPIAQRTRGQERPSEHRSGKALHTGTAQNIASGIHHEFHCGTPGNLAQPDHPEGYDQADALRSCKRHDGQRQAKNEDRRRAGSHENPYSGTDGKAQKLVDHAARRAMQGRRQGWAQGAPAGCSGTVTVLCNVFNG